MPRDVIVTKYDIAGPLDIRIALVTDLHEWNADRVVMRLREISPDIILVAGDTFERHDRGEGPDEGDHSAFSQFVCFFIMAFDRLFRAAIRLSDNLKSRRGIVELPSICSENSYRFLRAAGKIAPVYMSLGNHERYLKEQDLDEIKAAGVRLLDNEYTSVDMVDKHTGKNNRLWIGGLSSHPDMDMLERFAAEDGYKLLLCHHPEYYEPYVFGRGIDITFSGHAHGGQIRIGGKGLFAPGQGMFPKYHHGVYERATGGVTCGRNEYLVVSSGCSNTASIPRWGNPCEVVEVEIADKKW